MNHQQLLQQWSKFIDPHLFLPVLQFYEDSTILKKEFIQQEKLNTLLKTRLFDQVATTASKIKSFPNLSQKIEQEKHKTVYELQFSEEFNAFIQLLKDKQPEFEKEKFQKQIALKFISEWRKEFDKPILKYARIMYDCGKYDQSLLILNCVQYVIEDEQLKLQIMWGKLNCEYILGQYDELKEDINSMKQKLEDQTLFENNHHYHVSSRAQLMHLALQVYFQEKTTDADQESFIDLIGSEQFLGTLQMACPYMIRYLIAAIICSKNYQQYGQFNLKNLLNLISKDVCDYTDSFVEYIKLILIDFNFENAEKKLKQLSKDLKEDYFLSKKADYIIKNAQNLFFDIYCRIFDTVEIKLVSSFLESSIEDAEVWIVNLIRTSNIEAKIDSEKGFIHIIKNPPNFNEDISIKLRDVIPRTNLLVNNLKRILGKN